VSDYTYPDVEDVVLGLLASADLAEHRGRELPTNLRYRMPFVLVERRGGGDNGWTDSPIVNIDVLSSQAAVAKARAEAIRDLLTGDPLVLWPIDAVETVAGPQEIPHGDTAVRRWTATYQIDCRRVAVS
jgi:hypothetical protein